jgi:hypothetical protein
MNLAQVLLFAHWQENQKFRNMLNFTNLFLKAYINHFTQPDTIIPDPNNPQAYDRYA